MGLPNDISEKHADFIFFLKDDTIGKVRRPKFGEVTLHFQNNKFSHATIKETIK